MYWFLLENNTFYSHIAFILYTYILLSIIDIYVKNRKHLYENEDLLNNDLRRYYSV